MLLAAGAAMLLFTASMMMNGSTLNASAMENIESGMESLTKWNEWKVVNQKSYPSMTEEMYRFKVWMNNAKWISENQGEEYTLAINLFSDLTTEEFRLTYLMNNIAKPEVDTTHDMIVDESVTLPTSVNWATAGKTVQVLNQGQCGSCWAFSAVESLDSAYAMKGVSPVPNYSEQQVTSCSSAQGNYGCNGGWPVNAYKYIMAHPLCTNAQYPYTSGTTQLTGTCNNNLVAGCTTGGGISTYATVPTNNCGALEAAVAAQPVSVCVDASTWSSYSSGIFSNCGTQLDHCVMAVGYVEGQYWLVQNSWATSWGQKGFIQLKWGNTCGVCQQAQYPTAK